MIYPTSVRGQVGVLGLLLVAACIVGEGITIWRYTAIPGELEAAEKEFRKAVARASTQINLVGALRESNGTYYKMVRGPDGNPAAYDASELNQLRQSTDQRAHELANERLSLPPLMLGLIIPLTVGVALFLWGKDGLSEQYETVLLVDDNGRLL
jgi:hypothetical protein